MTVYYCDKCEKKINTHLIKVDILYPDNRRPNKYLELCPICEERLAELIENFVNGK